MVVVVEGDGDDYRIIASFHLCFFTFVKFVSSMYLIKLELLRNTACFKKKTYTRKHIQSSVDLPNSGLFEAENWSLFNKKSIGIGIYVQYIKHYVNIKEYYTYVTCISIVSCLH